MIPLKLFPKIEPCEHDEYAQCDDFLDDFQLEYRELAVADAIRRHLKAVLEESNQPTDDNDGNQRSLAVLQVAIPGGGHKDVRANEKEYGFHNHKSYHVRKGELIR